MITTSPKTVRVGNNKIYYLDSGDLDSLGFSTPIILMLPGWPVSCHLFDGLIAVLKKSFRCIAVDLPGWGNSTDNDGIFHSVAYNSAFIKDFMKALALGRQFSIFGYSTGGVIGAYYEYLYKDLVSLIMFSSPLNGAEHMRDRFAGSKKTKLIYYLFRVMPFLLDCLKVSFVREIVSKKMLYGFYLREGFGSIKYSTLITSIFANSYNLSPHAVFDIAVDLRGRDFVPMLQNSRCKPLFLSASKDRAVPPEHTVRYSKRFPNAKLHIFDGYDHFLILEDPVLLAQYLCTSLLNQCGINDEPRPLDAQEQLSNLCG